MKMFQFTSKPVPMPKADDIPVAQQDQDSVWSCVVTVV
jgi:hypothetical protein